LAAVVAAIAAFGCSGDEVATPAVDGGPVLDAGSDQSVQGEGAAPDAPDLSDASADVARRDGFVDIFDAFPIPDGQAGACASCVRDKCGTQVNDCVNSDVCRNGLVCTFMTCIGTGTPDLNCVLGCFNGDTAAAFAAIGALMCINMSCGTTCTPAFDAGPPGDSNAIDGAPADGTSPGDGAVVDSNATDGGAPPDDGGPSE
jgi:hypothetical protein